MENSAEEIARKKIVVIAVGFGIFVFVIFIIWMLLGVRWRNDRVTTLNREEVMSGESGMSQAEVERIETGISNIINEYYKDKVSGKAKMAIRQIKAEDGTTKTLVDVEDIRVTFEIGAVIHCAEFEDAKYTDGLCVTPEGRTTLSMVFGNGLPVQGSIEESEEGYRESVNRDKKNDKKRWLITSEPNDYNRPRLMIYPETCNEDEKYIESVKKYIAWLNKRWTLDALEPEVKCGVEFKRAEAYSGDPGDKK